MPSVRTDTSPYCDSEGVRSLSPELHLGNLELKPGLAMQNVVA